MVLCNNLMSCVEHKSQRLLTNKQKGQAKRHVPLTCPSFPRQDSAGRCFPSRPCALNLVCLLAPHSRVPSLCYIHSLWPWGGRLPAVLGHGTTPRSLRGGSGVVWCGVVCEGGRMPWGACVAAAVQ